jgi:hypothetical protein
LVEQEPARNGAALDIVGAWREKSRSGTKGDVLATKQDAKPGFAILGELATDIHGEVIPAQVICCDTVCVAKHVDGTALQSHTRCHKEGLPGIQRLVELAGQAARLSYLDIGAPFGAERIDPGAAMTGQQVEIGLAAEVGGQSQTEAQGVWPV